MNNDRDVAYLWGSGAAGGLWWFFDQLLLYGPSWSLMPPLLFGLASLVASVNVALNDRHKRRGG